MPEQTFFKDGFLPWVFTSKELSVDAKMARINRAVYAVIAPNRDNTMATMEPSWWITEIYSDYVIASKGAEEFLKVPYMIDDQGNVTVGKPVPVKRVWVEVAENAV